MKGWTNWKDATCVKCGFKFSEVLPFLVEGSEEYYHHWMLECICGQAYEIEYNGTYDECEFLHLKKAKGGPRIMLKDLIGKNALNLVSENDDLKRELLKPTERMEILERDKFRCQLCGATAKNGSRLEIDHKIPISKGGTSELSNLWTLCFTCNRGKRDKILKA